MRSRQVGNVGSSIHDAQAIWRGDIVTRLRSAKFISTVVIGARSWRKTQPREPSVVGRDGNTDMVCVLCTAKCGMLRRRVEKA